MDHTEAVLILLSTYNGEKYLRAQLDSIINQTHADWTLLVRDDLSSDQTIDILNEYSQKDARIQLVKDDLGNLNVTQSFSKLMQYALTRPENFIFFCDQDDVWLPEKLTLQITALNNLQTKYLSETPILIYSDLTIVNHQLEMIHPSYLQYEKIKRPSDQALNTLLINNFITGCTIGMNKSLLKLATSIPTPVRMHDWWCALCAATFGKIDFIAQATLLYRQHGSNVVGSRGFYKRIHQFLSLKKLTKKKHDFQLCFQQAEQLLKKVDATNDNFSLIENFVNLPNKNLFTRFLRAYQLNLKPSHFLRGLMFWMMLFAS